MNKMIITTDTPRGQSSPYTNGSYTFWRNPTDFTIPKKYRSYAYKPTYTSVAFFSWGMFIKGQEIVLEWDWMPDDTFAELQTILENDEYVTWNTQLGASYSVQVLKLDGKYLESALSDAPWRKDVKLTFLIRATA